MKISSERLTNAHYAAHNPIWIDTPSGLARAAKAWSRQSTLAIDTEFIRERTYFAKLGLVQISDAQTVWLVDIPALPDLQPLSDILTNGDVIKILHGGGEDLEIFQQQLAAPPQPLFDSQVAAAMLGYSLQLSYERLINELLPCNLTKGPSRSNWLQRPLTDDQILYAANDVAYLPLAAELLQSRLQTEERLQWHQQDMVNLIEQTQQPVDTDKLYLKVKGAGRLNGIGLALLQRLAAWRDQQAQTRDLPRSFVLNDQELVAVAEMAASKPAISNTDIKKLDDLHPRAKRRYTDLLVELLQHKPDQPLPELPGRPDATQRKQLSEMQAVVSTAAAALNVEPALLASKRVLQSIQRNHIETGAAKLLNGWRGHLLNAKLQTTLND